MSPWSEWAISFFTRQCITAWNMFCITYLSICLKLIWIPVHLVPKSSFLSKNSVTRNWSYEGKLAHFVHNRIFHTRIIINHINGIRSISNKFFCFSIETDCLDIYFDEETELKLPDWMQLKYAEDVIQFLIEADSPLISKTRQSQKQETAQKTQHRTISHLYHGFKLNLCKIPL